MRPRRKGKLQPLRDLVPRAYPRSDQADFLQLCAAWNRSVPNRVLKNARPIRFVRGRLIVHTLSSPWAAELDFMRDTLIRQLRQGAPKAGLRSLHFRVGPLPEIQLREPATRRPFVPVANLPEELARALARVADEDIREVIARAATVSLGRAEFARKRRDDD